MYIFKNKVVIFCKKTLTLLCFLSLFFLETTFVMAATPDYNIMMGGGGGAGGGAQTVGLQNYQTFDPQTGLLLANPTPIGSNVSGSAEARIIVPQSAPSTALDTQCGVNPAFQQWYYCMLAPVNGFFGEVLGSGASSTEQVDINKGLQPFIARLYVIGVSIAVGLSIVVISLGGIRMATADSIVGTAKGREMIKAAFAGLFLILFSYVLLNTINPYLVSNGVGTIFP